MPYTFIFMRWLFILLVSAIAFSVFTIFEVSKDNAFLKNIPHADRRPIFPRKHATTLARLRLYVDDAHAFTIKNNFNNSFCFLVDMKQASGKKRFFIYDLKNDSIIQSGLVTHGYGMNTSNGGITYSNEAGSYCTSPGKYKTGKAYYGKFGLSYKLHGLENTNSNALKRFVVLHAHPCVPDDEVAPQKICMSQGCPTVSPAFLQQLKPYIDHSDKPVLLWILP